MADSFAAFASEQPERAAFIGLSYRNALKRLKTRGLQFGTIIDVGATKGEWAKLARQVWPDSGIHMVEENPIGSKTCRPCARLTTRCRIRLPGLRTRKAAGTS